MTSSRYIDVPVQKVAVVGSRGWPLSRRREIEDYIAELPWGTIVVSGGATGVDSIAYDAARNMGLGLELYYPDYSQGSRAPLIRNERIASACHRMVAFWDGQSRGTMHAVNQARLRGKPVEIFT